MNVSNESLILDLRDIVPQARHDKIVSTFEGLAVGPKLVIINGNDPKPLYYYLCAEYEDEFEWKYLEHGPVEWKVEIVRLKEGKPLDFKARVEKALSEVRPYIQADGGDVLLVDITGDNVVKVSLTGACSGCPGAQDTMKMGVDRIIKEKVPGVARVEMI